MSRLSIAAKAPTSHNHLTLRNQTSYNNPLAGFNGFVEEDIAGGYHRGSFFSGSKATAT